LSDSKKEQETFLTEAILIIHNEVQGAVDYISTQQQAQGSEIGKGSAIMAIERIRLKVPIRIWLEKEQHAITRKTSIKPEEVRKNLSLRRGFSLGEKERSITFSKAKVELYPSKTPSKDIQTKTTDEIASWQLGEIEVVFMPLKRE
jgi:hypothetical protein